MYYTVFDTESEAKYISHLLYLLTPEGQRKKNPEGQMFSIFNINNGKFAFCFNGHKFKIDTNANLQTLIDVYKAKGEINSQEEQNIKDFIANNDWITINDIATTATKARFKNYDDMKADGWF